MLYYLLISCFVTVSVEANRTDYNGFQVYRLQPTERNQIQTLSSLNDDESYDFWSPINFDGKPIDVMVHPNSQSKFLGFLKNHQIPYTTFIDNVQTVFQREELIQKLSSRRTGIGFTSFHRFSEINSYLDQLSEIYPKKVRIASIGESYEGREMKVLQISTNFNVEKPIIFIDAGIHAREWLAPSQALYVIQQLVENPTNKHLLEKVDWHILPVVNPDGYEYSHDYNPNWRKTRSDQENECFGVDANRNFGFQWGRIGASSSPCSPTYKGPLPFSEIETQNVRDYINKHKNRIKLYLTLHSYGSYILYPWGYTNNLPADAFELHHLAEGVNRAIMAAGGKRYTVGSSTNILYAAAGGSDDWAKAQAGIALSYTIELPAGRRSGFQPEGEEIYEHVAQTFAGIVVFGRYIALKFGLEH